MMKKDELLKVLDLVLPAVAHRDLTESATMLCFRAKTVTAYNSGVAISVKLDTDFEGLLPGHVPKHLHDELDPTTLVA